MTVATPTTISRRERALRIGLLLSHPKCHPLEDVRQRRPCRPSVFGALDDRDRAELAQRRQTRQRLGLELPDTLARQVELVADRLQRPRLALEAEPQLEDAPLALGESVECLAHALAAERLLRLVERVGGLAVREEVTELALVVGADRLVQRHRCVSRAERRVDVLHRQARRLGQLVLRRLAAELDLEPARCARELLLALDHVHRHADRAGVIRDGALHRLSDPPGCVGRELEAAAPVELLDGAVQPQRSLLDQVEERNAEPAIALRNRDDEPEVRLDHAALGEHVAALDRLRERDFLGSSEQLVAPDVREEELKRVGRADDDIRIGSLLLGLRRLRILLGPRLRDLEADRLELPRQLLDVSVVEVVLERERLELRRLDVTALFGGLDQGAGPLGLQKLRNLLVRQLRFLSLSYFPGFLHCKTASGHRVHRLLTVGRVSWSFQGEAARYCGLLRKTSARTCLFRCGGLFGSCPSRKLELDLALIIQDEPSTKRFASSGGA